MPQNIAAKYRAAGWRVLETDGHDAVRLYAALRACRMESGMPCALLAHTVMGKGVPFIEGDYRYHGTPLSARQYEDALAALEARMEPFATVCAVRSLPKAAPGAPPPPVKVKDYPQGEKTTAFGGGSAMLGVARHWARKASTLRGAGLRLSESSSSARFPGMSEAFCRMRLQEHNATCVAAGLSQMRGVFYAEFGPSTSTSYGQLRIIDLTGPGSSRGAPLRLDVGEKERPISASIHLAVREPKPFSCRTATRCRRTARVLGGGERKTSRSAWGAASAGAYGRTTALRTAGHWLRRGSQAST